MKTILKILFSTMLCVSLNSGCSMIDFSEDCFYTGNVNVLFDWKYLPEGDEKPELMGTFFYPDNSGYSSYWISKDTLIEGLAADYHQVLAFNRVEGVSIYETDCPCTAYAQMDIYTKNGKTYSTNVPAMYAAKREIQVSAFETTECLLVPKPCYQQVFIDFIIIRENIDTQITALTGELGGISIKYSFSEMKGIRSEALLPFTGNETAKDTWHTALKVFGMNPKEAGQAKISNKLNINLVLSNQTIYDANIDLTSVFENFTSPEIYLKLEIRLSSIGISLSIADWYTGEGGDIDL